MPRTAKLTAEGIGPFATETSVEFPLDSPIIILNGPNGIGKGHLMRLLQRLLGDQSVTPERTHGRIIPARGSLETEGRKIGLTLTERWSPSKGLHEFPIRLAAGEGRTLADIIGPVGDEDSKSDVARKARVNALARLANIPITPATLSDLAARLDVSLVGWKDPSNIVAIAGELKRRLEQVKRDHQAKAQTLAGEIRAVESQINGLGSNLSDPGIAIETARAQVTTAQRELFRIEASHAARVEQERQRAALRSDIPEPTWMPVRAAIIDLNVQLGSASPVDADFAMLRRFAALIDTQIAAVGIEAESYRRTHQALTTPITGHTAEDVENARANLTTAQTLSTRATNYAAYLRLSVELEGIVRQRDLANEQARLYETAAQTVHQRLADLIRHSGLEVLSLDAEGEVIVDVGDKWVPFATRSLGERVADGIKATIGATDFVTDPRPAIVALHWEYFGALDAISRDVLRVTLDDFAGKVVLLTELPDSTVDGIVVTT